MSTNDVGNAVYTEHMKIQADTIDEYFAKTGEREADLRRVDELISQQAPHLQRALYNNMGGGAAIGYGLMPYQTAAMKEPSEWPLLALANQKRYLALYICAVIDGEYIAEKYAGELGRVNVGRSCVRFKKFDDINVETLANILRDLDGRYAAGEKLFGR